jgi:asparagine synthase (glutamine-hydrolysing)
LSGLCGWFGFSATVSENRQLLENMAGPISRFDCSDLQFVSTSSSAIALATLNKSGDVYKGDALSVAVRGQSTFHDSGLAQKAKAIGFAKTIADEWRIHGAKVLEKLSGAFSICILDEGSGTAILAVDRMATYPLTYQVSGTSLIFGSSADSINLHPRVRPVLDHQGIYNYVYFHVIPSPCSIYKNHIRLLPGEYLKFSNGKAEVEKYWRPRFSENGSRNFDDLKQEFLHLLRTSVRDACGGQKVGAFLSGGTDSSTVSGILGQVTGEPAKTYSIGFAAEGYDETEYARIAARHFSTSHHEYYVTPEDVVAAIPKVASIFDVPFGNASAVPAYYCALMAKEDGVDRLLGGDGGDELFGGNERYAKQHIFSLYERIPAALRSLINPVLFGIPKSHHIKVIGKARSYVEQASIPMPARLETYNLLERYGYGQVFTAEFLAEINVGQPLELLNQTYAQTDTGNLLNKMLALDWKFTLADNDLPKVVKACELAGMEVTFPLLNDEIISFSERLAPQLKLKGTKLRYFFKEALRGEVLPDEIINKQKHGFGLPFGVWLKDNRMLRTLAADSLNNLKSRNIVRSDFIDNLLNNYLGEHAGYHGTMVWILMMLEQWFDQHATASYDLVQPTRMSKYL